MGPIRRLFNRATESGSAALSAGSAKVRRILLMTKPAVSEIESCVVVDKSDASEAVSDLLADSSGEP